jgi:hypothetical protein
LKHLLGESPSFTRHHFPFTSIAFKP